MKREETPIIVKPIQYALELEDNKYYIGTTYNLNIRYAQHCSGNGARWTSVHKPIKICEISFMESEKDMTLRYMSQYGYLNVRGYCWCQTTLKTNPLENVKKKKKIKTDKTLIEDIDECLIID